MVRRDAAINRTEDLNVEVCEATEQLHHPQRLYRAQSPARSGRWRSQEIRKPSPGSKQSRVIAMLQSPSGSDDCRDDEGNGLAAALGARLSCRRGAQTPQAEARLEEGRRQPGLPDRERRQRQGRGLAGPSAGRPERHAARQDRSCPAGPEVTRRRDCALARSRRR